MRAIRILVRGRPGLEPLPLGLLREQRRRAPPPAGEVARAGDPVVAGGLASRGARAPRGRSSRRSGESGCGLEPLRRELVVDEPPVRALDPLLDRPRPDRVALARARRARRGSAQRARRGPRRLPRPAGGQGSAASSRARRAHRRRARRRRGPGPWTALQRFLGLARAPGASRSRTSSTNGERVAGRPSSSELRQQSQRRSVGRAGAGVEEVALLGRRLLPDERRDAEAPPPLVAQQRDPRGRRPGTRRPGARRRTGGGLGRPAPGRGSAPEPFPRSGPATAERRTSSSSSSASAGVGAAQPGTPSSSARSVSVAGGRRRGAQLERRERHGRRLAALAPERPSTGSRPAMRLLGELVRGGCQRTRATRRAGRASRSAASIHGGAFQPAISSSAVRASPRSRRRSTQSPIPCGSPGRARMKASSSSPPASGRLARAQRHEAAAGGGSSQRHATPRPRPGSRSPRARARTGARGDRDAAGPPRCRPPGLRRRAAGRSRRRPPRPRRARRRTRASRSRRRARPAGAGLEQVAVEVAQRGALRVAVVEGELALLRAPELVAQPGQQRGPRRQRLAVLVVDGDRDLAGAGERRHQLELLLGQVVEAVEEHRPRAPGLRPLAQRRP